ncbi:hypothetical protein TNCV_1604821 [Trichonephila clavipes]|nr:hypothetical protein TNCV_1604821 [Trichonephila clavipes]
MIWKPCQRNCSWGTVAWEPRILDKADTAVAMPLNFSEKLPLRLQQHRSDKTIWSDLNFLRTATAGSDVVQSGRPIFDDFFQHLWPYTGNNTVNVVFQMVKRLWLIRIDQ